VERGIWITWERQRRNIGISSALEWPLYEMIDNSPRPIRYGRLIMETTRTLLREKPDVVCVQNPSIILALLGVLCKGIMGYRCIVDAHNSGLMPLEGRSAVLMKIARWIQRGADLTIVTNEEMKTLVEANGGRSVILPDRTPEVPPVEPVTLRGDRVVTYVCTFSEDEPYEAVIEAAGLLEEDIVVYITGNHRGRIDAGSLPPNVELTGFIDEAVYWSLLASSDAVMVLTLREGCLVCGAYETVALGRPLILSDTEVLRSYFSRGCVYVSPDSRSIAEGIRIALKRDRELLAEIRRLRGELDRSWKGVFSAFQEEIQRL
jgi:glycosyltransferase involved in cell wall biosynthesis